MRRLLASIIAGALLWIAPAQAFTPGQRQVVLNGVQGWSLPNSSADLYFALNGGSCAINRIGVPCSSLISTSRASTGLAQWSDGHWSSFAANQPRITDQGLLVEDERTNLFLNSQVPITQTITVVSGSTYTVSVYGLASIILSGAGSGTVTQGAPVTFTASTTSLVCTVSGAGGIFQNVNVELGSFATSPIITTGSPATRAADVIALIGPAQSAALNGAAAFIQTYAVTNNGGGSTQWPLSYSGGAFLAFPSSSSVYIRNSTSQLATATYGSGTLAGISNLAFSWAATFMHLRANGGTQATNANPWTGNTGTVYVGNRGTLSRGLYGYIKRLAFGNSSDQFNSLAVAP